jgi:HD-like signal output (HDOD) protein
MHVMRMANSVAFNPTAQPVHDMRAAVGRIGSRMVHAAALTFVMQQLRNAEDLRTVRDRLNALWRRGIIVGSVGKALATQIKIVAPDVGLLAGLLHVVGKLYVLTRMNRLPQLLEQEGVAERIMDEWSGNIGKALLENWELPAEFGEAVANFDNPDRELRGPVDLTDVLSGAHVLADLLPPSPTDYLDQIQLAEVFQQNERLWQRLKLTRENCSDALHTALIEVQQLRALFGA